MSNAIDRLEELEGRATGGVWIPRTGLESEDRFHYGVTVFTAEGHICQILNGNQNFPDQARADERFVSALRAVGAGKGGSDGN